MIKIKLFNLILVRIQIESSRPINCAAEIRWKKSFKRQFESNFKQNLAEGRCNRISLVLHSYTFLLHSKHVKKNVQNITHNESVKYNYATYLVHYLQLILYLFCTFVQYIFFFIENLFKRLGRPALHF